MSQLPRYLNAGDRTRFPLASTTALELPLASETGECLSFVFESMFGGRSAPR